MDTTTRSRATAPVVLDAALAAVMGDAGCRPFAEAVRVHAVEVACLARELAPLIGADPRAAFAAGLLHDIGVLLLLRRDPVGYRDLLDGAVTHGERLRREKAQYGTDHALLGAEHLLDRRMPDPVADAVADHHDPHGSSASTTVVVSAADELLGLDATRRNSVHLLDIGRAALSQRSEP